MKQQVERIKKFNRKNQRLPKINILNYVTGGKKWLSKLSKIFILCFGMFSLKPLKTDFRNCLTVFQLILSQMWAKITHNTAHRVFCHIMGTPAPTQDGLFQLE